MKHGSQSVSQSVNQSNTSDANKKIVTVTILNLCLIKFISYSSNYLMQLKTLYHIFLLFYSLRLIGIQFREIFAK